ncbi:MAG: TRAP transporter substrate-binding protein [Desulfobacteraceae bacterium]|nr:MAG: TRAP transporter substrate-binding protein [Desulfobacteraceae bacterium]
MKKSRAFMFVILLTAIAAIAAPAAHAKKVLIKLQQAYGANLPTLGINPAWWAQQLNEVSGGDINVKIFEPGKLVAPFEILDAVSAGKIDAGIAGDGFFAGKIPAGQIFSSIPFGPEAAEYMAWYYHGNGAKLHQWVYDESKFNVKVIPVTIIPPETAGWFKKPIASVEDFKGLKMRFYGLGGQMMQKLGMSVNLMPAGELFPALEKGVIDATEFSTPAIDQRLGFHKLVKYNYFPGWHQQATIIPVYFNKNVWNSLDKAQQKIVEITCMASMTNALAQGEYEQGAVIRENIEKNGVKNMFWSDEMLALFQKTWEEVAKEQCEKDPVFKKAFDDLMAFRKDYAYWQSNGFLPRNCKK